MTNFVKKSEIKNDWLLIDANNIVVGRLAAFISKVLRGKNKTQFTPHMDNGDFVVVTNIEKIKFTGKKLHNKNLLIEGLLLTMYDTRLNLSNLVKKEVKLHFNEMVFKTIIHRNVRLGEATSYGKSIIDYDVSSKGADNYLNLAKEIISKN